MDDDYRDHTTRRRRQREVISERTEDVGDDIIVK